MKNIYPPLLLVLLFQYNFVFAQDAKVNGTFIINLDDKGDKLLYYEATKSNGRYTLDLNSSNTTKRADELSTNSVNQTNSSDNNETAVPEVITSDAKSLPQDNSETKTSPAQEFKSSSVTFDEMSLDVFKRIFPLAVKQLLTVPDDTKLDQIAVQVFFQIQAKLAFLDDQPSTARFILKKDKIMSYLSSNSSPYFQGLLTRFLLQHQVRDLEIEIEHGAIKNITLRVTTNEHNNLRDFLIFKNQFPFTSSSKFDPEELNALRLFCINCGGKENITRFVKVGELAIVDNILENNKEDYSPYNQTFILNSNSPIKEVQKELRSKILDIAAYTDFNGFNGENPNGIIQIEASRRINLFTKHFLLGVKRDLSNYIDFGKVVSGPDFIEMRNPKKSTYRIGFKLTPFEMKIVARNIDDINNVLRDKTAGSKELKKVLKKLPKSIMYKDRHLVKDITHKYPDLVRYDLQSWGAKMGSRSDTSNFLNISYRGDTIARYYSIRKRKMTVQYINFLGYFEPKFRFSKIEENNKILSLPDSVYNGGIAAVDPIDLYQFQKLSFGGDLNLIKHSIPQTKVNIYLNSGILWYQTRLKASSSQNESAINVDAFNYNTNLFVKFNPDGRWGCSLGAEYSKSFFLNQDYRFASNSEILQYKFDAFFATNQENRLFFRYRLLSQIGNSKNSFSQIQFGYSMNIFQTSSRTSN